MEIIKAKENDKPIIKEILKELELDYASQTLDHFWVLRKDNQIAGIVKLEPHHDYIFLGSFGVAKKFQKQGLARKLIENVLKNIKQDIYLYTIIPEFFEKFGFQITQAPKFIPTKERYECDQCQDPVNCVCMLRPAKAGVRKA